MRIKILFSCFLLLLVENLYSQQSQGYLFGSATFVTSSNVYVKFENTTQISSGDTLFLFKLNIATPAIVVKNKSSNSCVGEKISDSEITKGDTLVFKLRISSIGDANILDPGSASNPTGISAGSDLKADSKLKERVFGRISAGSYSNLSPESTPGHRTIYQLSLNINNIRSSKLSFESYINFRQNFPSKESSYRQKDMYFNIYNLALKYDFTTSTSVVLGRKINNKISSVGAIDGIQIEKFLGNFFLGGIAGFRPDLTDYSLNTDLFEYGGYMGLSTNSPGFYSQSTIGLLQQKNKGNVDRRYAYFQHNSTINKDLTLFTSFEVDIFNTMDGKSVSDPRLTNLYTSARYRINKSIDVGASFDSRKRIIYYESYKSEIERILDNDETMQGVRLSLNVRLFKYTMSGISYNRRFQSNSQNKSDNLNAYLTFNKIPSLGGRITVNFNSNNTNYLESRIFGVRHSRPLIDQKLNAEIYSRILTYNYLNTELVSEQQYYGLNLIYYITRKTVFSLLGELSTTSISDNYRINARIIKRFDNKKKNK